MLTNEIHICNFFTMDDVLVRKVTISASLKKINFPKISGQAPLTRPIFFFLNFNRVVIDYRLSENFMVHYKFRLVDTLAGIQCISTRNDTLFEISNLKSGRMLLIWRYYPDSLSTVSFQVVFFRNSSCVFTR